VEVGKSCPQPADLQVIIQHQRHTLIIETSSVLQQCIKSLPGSALCGYERPSFQATTKQRRGWASTRAQ
jgi:hypothetical protein